MPSTKTHDIVATVGTYKSQGEEKKRYANCGSAFTDDQGRISLKLDTVPVSPEWSGWLSLYPVEQKQQGGQERGYGNRPHRNTTTPEEARRVNNAHKQQGRQGDFGEGPVTEGMEDDDIPF